ncbi:MAG: YggS family pyridoxal phosphate-dependent enzyme, partial [Actinomycetota bacterium]|nr:YggS family pyridoxal phosphate-dependent enzyme [Actinomycetota bacterium]
MTTTEEVRRGELSAGLARVRDRIDAACRLAGRPRAEVQLVVVTKTFPASDVRLLVDLGVHEVGESRDQEAAAKAASCADLQLTWHFVGRLQSNKARSVASYASVVHSVDRLPLVAALA